jgi:predicted glycogen debranching enzyme
MLTHKGLNAASITVSIQGKPLDSLLDTEWLLTNSRGGFAAGSVIGCNTRRYHGLLIGTQSPPANRIRALSNCLETISFRGGSFSISNFEFDHAIHPNGYVHLLEFRKDLGVHFEYTLDFTTLTKSVYLLPDSDIVAVVYDFSTVAEPFDFALRPFAALQDFHALGRSDAELSSVWDEQQLTVSGRSPHTGLLCMRCDDMQFEQNAEWWYRFLYRVERRRGQDCFEDLWSPGSWHAPIDGPQRIVLWAGLFADQQSCLQLGEMELQTAVDAVALREKEFHPSAGADAVTHKLASAAGQFVIERTIGDDLAPTILAGYPWFLDWGRDTFIALEGLCLCTQRYDVAWGVLKTFAAAISEGMIPNRFDDYGNPPHYNSIDASLWFVHAAFRYLHVTGDRKNFSAKLLPAVKWILDSYRRGTRFGIHADVDKLITGGDVDTQLTWMDAKYNGIAFTPRYGKPVEVNALWYSNLCSLADFHREKNADEHRFYRDLADQVRRSFNDLFWNESKGYLNDCILPGGKADTSLRPNQIFAISLPFTPLNIEQANKVVHIVEQELLTPFGLRSLAPSDPRYKKRYVGSMGQRDAAYHQGTVWAWLIGPFVEAYLKVHGSDPAARRRCRSLLAPLIQHLTENGCLGTISEIFDGDPPHRPRGAFAQAWSVAEVLRAWLLCKD